MKANLYEISKELIGELPLELEFVYGIAAILLFLVVILCACMPFILLYKVFDK